MTQPPRAARSRARPMPAFASRLPIVTRVCRRVAAGETVEEICRDPLMPLRQELHAWVAEEPEFSKMMRAARRRSGRAGLAREGRPGLWTEELQAEFLLRIEDGRGLVEVCSEPDMPTHTTIYRWLRSRPDFAADYALARQVQSDVLFDLAWRVARRAADGEIAAPGARLVIDAIKWRCGRIAPRRYGTAMEAARTERDAAAAEALAERDQPLPIVIRKFARGPDGKSVIEVFPDPPHVIMYDQNARDRGRAALRRPKGG